VGFEWKLPHAVVVVECPPISEPVSFYLEVGTEEMEQDVASAHALWQGIRRAFQNDDVRARRHH